MMGNFTNKLFCDNSNNDKIISECIPLSLHLEDHRSSKYEKKLQDFNPCSRTNDILNTPTINKKTEKFLLENHFNIEYKYWLDPRSPSVVYPRTPILIQSITDSISKNISSCKEKLEICETEDLIKNDSDPRSPALEFDRTPILKLKTLNKLKSLSQQNLKELRNYSNSNVCARLSYCESTNFYNISEIQALPDVTSLKTICYHNEKSNKLNLSPTTDDFSTNDFKKINSHFKLVSEKQPENKNNIAITESEEDIAKEKIDLNEVLNKSIEYMNTAIGNDEKFVIWRDFHSPKLLSVSPKDELNHFKGILEELSEKKEVLIEFDENSKMNSKKNYSKIEARKVDQLHLNEKFNEDSVRNIGKKNKDIKSNKNMKLIDLDCKNISEISKNRTPLANRSNNISHVQLRSINCPPLQKLQNKNDSRRKLQENTLPVNKNEIMNVKSKLNNTTNWDLETTMLI